MEPSNLLRCDGDVDDCMPVVVDSRCNFLANELRRMRNLDLNFGIPRGSDHHCREEVDALEALGRAGRGCCISHEERSVRNDEEAEVFVP